MPVLTVKGMPEDVNQDNLETLIFQLQAETGVPLGIPPDEVSVFFPTDIVKRGIGEELICLVDGLFDSPERTVELRQRLARLISVPLGAFAFLCLPQCRKIEVIVNRWDQEIDGFAACTLHAIPRI